MKTKSTSLWCLERKCARTNHTSAWYGPGVVLQRIRMNCWRRLIQWRRRRLPVWCMTMERGMKTRRSTCRRLLKSLKQLSSRCSKNKIWKQILKLTVNTGQVMFSGEICYYWPLIQLTNRWQNIAFLCIIYCVTNAVAVMYSRNIPMAEQRIVCFQSKKVNCVCDLFYF